MDDWMGANIAPITLQKYLYSPNDPLNNIDPSGNSFLSQIGASFTVKAVLGNAAVGSIFGGVDSYLGGQSVASGAASGAVKGGLLGPLAWVERLRKPLVTTFTALGFAGAADSASNGNYGQAAFRGIGSAFGAYVFLKTSIVPSQVRAPSIVDGNVYSGVYHSRTGQIVLVRSSTERPVPAGSVSNRGGHGEVARQSFPGADSSELFGFTVFARGNGVARVEFFSRSVNRGSPGNLVPEALQPTITRVIGSATGRITVGGR